MLIALRVELNKLLPKRFAAAADRYLWGYEPDASKRTSEARGDAHLSEPGGLSTAGTELIELDAPSIVRLPAVRHETDRYLKLMDTHTRRMVAVIQLISPSIKACSEERDRYLARRIDLVSAGVNLVELDLLRSGERLPSDPPLPPADYFALVCRAQRFPKLAVWPISVRDTLPKIPIPLDASVADVTLPLRACLDRVYDEGRYDQVLDYARPPTPPLAEPDASWARQLLAGRGR
jgi:hypothetical protein